MSEVLRVEHLTKSFPGVRAVDDVSFSLQRGEILALVGENGAGKSTLMQVICGAIAPDSGAIILDGQPVSFASTHQAILSGVSMVFQELSMVGGLSIAENIFAARQPAGRFGTIQWRALHRQTEEFLTRFGLHLDPRVAVKRLPLGTQQILEVLKAISTSPKLLLLDEPTSSLTEADTNFLFQNIRRMRDEGISFIYTTHKLSEVFAIADRVLVLRDGHYVGARAVSEVTESDLVAMMVGREIAALHGAATTEPQAGPQILEVRCLAREGSFADISFGIRAGEILGMAGLVGAGRTEIARSIFGLEPLHEGEILLDGMPVQIRSPQEAINHRIAYLTEDRKGQGLFLGMTVRENLVAATLRKFTTAVGLLQKRRIAQQVQSDVQTYRIATTSTERLVWNLSGGNQQKCLVALWLAIKPRVLMLDEPTRGVDVGARQEIYQLLRETAAAGTAILLISSELPELIGMCDRIIVVRHGTLAGEVVRADFSEERILSYAAGVAREVPTPIA